MTEPTKVHPAVEALQNDLRQGKISRRSFIRYATLLGLSFGAATVAAQCTVPVAPQQAPTTAPAAGERPKKMAAAEEAVTLQVGMDIPVQLDPAFASSDSEIAILNAVYDYLVDVDHDLRSSPGWRPTGKSATMA